MTFYDFPVLCMVVNPEGFETGKFFNFQKKTPGKVEKFALAKNAWVNLKESCQSSKKIFQIGLFVRKCSQTSKNSVRLEIDKRKHVRKVSKV